MFMFKRKISSNKKAMKNMMFVFSSSLTAAKGSRWSNRAAVRNSWLAAAAFLLISPLVHIDDAVAATQDQFDFRQNASQGGQYRHQFTVKKTGRHDVKLTWNQNINANVVISNAAGAAVLVLDRSTPGQRQESGSKWMTAGQRMTATVYTQKHSNLNYHLDINADVSPESGSDGAGNFRGTISRGQQLWHWFRVGETSNHNFNLSWTLNGGDADIVVTRTDGAVVGRANSSGTNRKTENLALNFNRGEEYYAKIFVISGSNLTYNLNIAADGDPDEPDPDEPDDIGHNAGYHYLDDANVSVRSGGDIGGLGYPRVMLTETQATTGPYGRYSTYQAMAVQGSGLHAAAAAQAVQPIHVHRMFTPTVTLEDRFDDRAYRCTQGLGIPFEDSTATTGGCGVWAGHLVYSAATQLSQAMPVNAGAIRVNNAAGFRPNTYLAIYDGGIKGFRNAEHVRITRIEGNTIYLAERFKSKSRARSAGAWVRQHADGGRGNKSWVFNLSSQGPRDANGRTIAEYMANWLASNLTRDVDGRNQNVKISGITFDVDTYVDVFTKDSDVNNDGVIDRGISPSGVHWWGEGVDTFYRLIRARFPGFVIVGGVQLSGGYDSLNGTQIEGFPNGQLWKTIDNFGEINSMISTYLVRMGRSEYGPAMVQNLLKFGTALYPTHGRSRYGNAPMRLGLGLTAMDAGFFHHENTRQIVDTWYDEYSVVTNRSAPNYGEALVKSDYRQVRNNTGWLGQPRGRFQRLYNANSFNVSNAISASTFEAFLGDWSSSSKLNISRSSSQKRDGAWGLTVSYPSSWDYSRSGARVQGPQVNIQSGRDYTLVFSARSDKDRDINVKLGKYTETMTLGSQWRRYVMSFRATESGLRQIRFDVGLHRSNISLDSVFVFNGNANVFRRDFDRGSVIANATPAPVTVTLGGGYRRIKGRQDPINNGAVLPDTVTIPAWDALFALKR